METTATTRASVTSVGLRYGLLTGLVSILLSFASNVLHLQENWAIRVLSIAILVLGVILAQREFKQRNAGFMSFGEGVGVGVMASVVIGVLSAAFFYLYVMAIDPELPTQILDKARADMEAKGNLSDEQIDQAMAITGKFMTPSFMTLSALFFSVLSGLLISLISSAFIKHSKPEFE